MSKYRELRMNQPKLTIKEGAREVIFKTVSNWQMKHPKHEIEWEADENMWGGVIAMINSGTEVIEEVKSR
jgi:hypothetical protein